MRLGSTGFSKVQCEMRNTKCASLLLSSVDRASRSSKRGNVAVLAWTGRLQAFVEPYVGWNYLRFVFRVSNYSLWKDLLRNHSHRTKHLRTRPHKAPASR
jgi:hypothetical protein